MITISIRDNDEKAKDMLVRILKEIENSNIEIIKKRDVADTVSLKEKIIELEGSLYNEKRGQIYKTVLEMIERPLIECILKRTDGNQLKAAKILGLKLNTMRAKINKLGIDPKIYKE
jgi:DNA-binding protein Fis